MGFSLDDCMLTYREWEELGYKEHPEIEIAALREQIAAKDEALWQAAILADIASDWNLDEIEIDGEMVLTYDLYKRFMQALEVL